MNDTTKVITAKRPLVLWSGGFDSTALVIEKLKTGDIDILYVNLDNNDQIQKHERRAINKLKVLITDANLPGKIMREHKFGYQTIAISKTIFALPILWIQAIMFTVDSEIHSEINIGYVKYDDIWHLKTEMMNAYRALLDLSCNDDDVVPLKFPFEWRTKEDILKILQDFAYTQQVLQTVYYCESGNAKPCGTCCSCLRHQKELGKTPLRNQLLKIDVTDHLADICNRTTKELVNV